MPSFRIPVLATRLFWLAAILLLLPACSGYQYEDPLRSYVINLQCVDESGQPLSNVTIETEKELKGYQNVKSTALYADGSFHLKADAQWIDLTLSKEGFADKPVSLRADSLDAWFRRTDDAAPFRLTLYKPDESVEPEGGTFSDLTVTGRMGDPVIDLDALSNSDHGALARVTANLPMPANALFAKPERAADGSQSLTLHLTRPDSGFIAFSPRPFDDPFEQMQNAPAPATGYAPSFTLSRERLAELALHDGNPAHQQYLYFHVDNRYGRLRLAGTGSRHSLLADGISFNLDVVLLPPGVTHFPVHECTCH